MKKSKVAAAIQNFPVTNAGPRGLANIKTAEQIESERVAREAQIMSMLDLQLGNVETELKKPFDAAPKFAVEVRDINGTLTGNVIDENTPPLADAPIKEEE